jgi:hypothetical protein
MLTLDDDRLAGEAFMGAWFGARRPSPEEDLLAAVLLQAVRDAALECQGYRGRSCAPCNARAWLRGELGMGWVTHVGTICDHFGLPHAKIVAGIGQQEHVPRRRG